GLHELPAWFVEPEVVPPNLETRFVHPPNAVRRLIDGSECLHPADRVGNLIRVWAVEMGPIAELVKATRHEAQKVNSLLELGLALNRGSHREHCKLNEVPCVHKDFPFGTGFRADSIASRIGLLRAFNHFARCVLSDQAAGAGA